MRIRLFAAGEGQVVAVLRRALSAVMSISGDFCCSSALFILIIATYTIIIETMGFWGFGVLGFWGE